MYPKILSVPSQILMPIVLVLSFIGAYAIAGQATLAGIYNLAIALGMGIIGYFLKRDNYPISPIVLGLILGGMTTKSNIIGLVGPVDGGDAARYNRGFVLGVQSVNQKAKIMIAHTGSFSDFVKAGDVAQAQIKSGADVLTGSSQQALGALRAVAEYKDKDIWWVGQDMAQLSIAEGYKCIAASSYNYAAVIVGMVQKLDANVHGDLRCVLWGPIPGQPIPSASM